MKRYILKGLLAGIALTGFEAIAIAQDTPAMNRDQALQQNQQYMTFEDGADIVVSGTISELSEEDFMLNYEGGNIEVELDDWDWADDADIREYLNNGDRVIVSGEVDDDSFEGREIEADNVYLQQDYAYYYVIDTNPAYYNAFNDSGVMRDGTYISARGEVKNISGREFTLSAQGTQIQVDTADLAYNPMARENGASIKEGDRVFVYGEIDNSFFDERELSAVALVTINRINLNTQNRQDKNQTKNRDGRTGMNNYQ